MSPDADGVPYPWETQFASAMRPPRPVPGDLAALRRLLGPDPIPTLDNPRCGCASVRIVTFDACELAGIRAVAHHRRIEVSQRMVQRGIRSDADRERTEFIGATGEAGVAKFTGTWWMGTARGARDVGSTLEVRAAERHTYRLLVYPSDLDHSWVVFATVERLEDPVVWLHGTIQIGDAKRREWWASYLERPAHCVPHGALGPLPQRTCVAYGMPGKSRGPVA